MPEIVKPWDDLMFIYTTCHIPFLKYQTILLIKWIFNPEQKKKEYDTYPKSGL